MSSLIVLNLCVCVVYHIGSFKKKPRVDSKWTGTGIEIVNSDKLHVQGTWEVC